MADNSNDENPFWKGIKPPVAIAHRGGGAAFRKEKFRRENTLEAFQNSVKLGYIFLEMDVIQTSDNKVIVIHVAKNKAEAKQGKREAPDYQKLQTMTLEELRTFSKRHIPTLDEVFREFPDRKFFIDAKSDRVVEHLAKEIRINGVGRRVCCGSFYPHRVKELHQLLGNKISYRLMISRSPVHLYQQWRSMKKLKDIITAVDLPSLYLTKRNINYIHRRKLKALVWTPNTARQIGKAIDYNADGIFSDDISLLKEIVLKSDPKNTSFSH